MNNKISLKNFAEVLSKELNISEEESEVFIKQLFETISSELKAGNEVYLDGIGTFSITNEGSDPVEFRADKDFAEAVNAQYAIFTPMQIDDEVSDKTLDTIIEPEKKEEKSEPKLIAAKATAQSTPVIISSNDEPVLISSSTEPVQIQSSVTVPEVEPTPAPQPPVEQPRPVVPIIPAVPAVPQESQVPQVPQIPPVPQVPQESSKESKESQVSQAPKVEPEKVPASPTKVKTKKKVPESRTNEEYETEDYIEDYMTQSGSKFGLGFFVGLIIGLAIGVLALCAYILYFVNATPGESDAIAEFVVSHCSKML